MTIRLEPGNCLEVMRRLAEEGVKVDAIVTDPPYHLTSIVKRFGNPDSAPAKSDGATGVYGRASSGFMGKAWDGGDVAFNSVTWGTAASLLKPGGWLLAFGGTRTYHKLGWAVEGGGFEIRDMVSDLIASDGPVRRFMASLNDEQQAAFLRCLDESQFGGMLSWLFGSGFPKSHDVSKAIDRQAGAERTKVRHAPRPETSGTMSGASDTRPWIERSRELGYHEVDSDEPATDEAAQWQGWGTALKPACEPICVARKPLSEGSVAANVLEHGTGALNVDGCRVGNSKDVPASLSKTENAVYGKGLGGYRQDGTEGGHDPNLGRWPANVCHDGSPEVEEAFAAFGERDGAVSNGRLGVSGIAAEGLGARPQMPGRADTGTASRFYYTAKADKHDRWGSKHPTVKPVDLMRWLVRLVTPPGGLVLDPFAGSGTTGIAAMAEGFDCILIEREEEYLADIRERLAFYEGDGKHSLASKHRKSEAGHDDLPLFGNKP